MQKQASYYATQYLARQRIWQPWHTLMDRWEKWYYLDHYDQTDTTSTTETQAAYKHIDTAAFDFIRQMTAMVTTPKPVRRILTDHPTSDKWQAIADDAEKYLAAVWEMNRQRAPMDVRTAIVFDQLVRSAAFIYVYVDDARLKLYKKEKGLPRPSYFPLCIEVLNPKTCFPSPIAGRWSWTDSFIRAEKMSPRAVANIWGESAVHNALKERGDYTDNEGELSDETELDYLDVWEWDIVGDVPKLFNGIVYEGEWLIKPRDMSDTYRDMPIVLMPAYDMPNDRPERRYWSPIEPLIHITRTGERLTNRIMTAAAFNANPQLVAINAADVPISSIPGGRIDLRSDQAVSYLSGVTVPPILQQMYQIVQGDMDRASLARAHYGNAPASWSGTTMNQSIIGSQMKLQPIIENLKRGLSAIDQRLLDLTVTVFGDGKVTAYYSLGGNPKPVTIRKASDLDGFRVDTSLTPKSPTDEQVRMGIALGYRSPGPSGTPLMSDEMIRREIMAIEDETALNLSIYKERIAQSPTIQKYVTMQALKESGWPQEVVDAAVKDLETQLGIGQPPGGGPPGAPPGPGGPPQAPPGAAPQGAPPPQPQGAGEPTPEQAIQMLQQAMQAGKLPPEIAQQAIKMLQEGQPVAQVTQWIQQQAQGGQAAPGAAPQGAPPPPPQGGPPMPGQPMPMPPGRGIPPGGMPPQGGPPMPQGAPGGNLRAMIEQAMAEGQLPPEIGQQAIAMLEQGAPPQEVVASIEQAMQQTKMGGLTIEQAVAELQRVGAPEQAIMELQALAQSGMGIDEALRVVLAKYGGQVGA